MKYGTWGLALFSTLQCLKQMFGSIQCPSFFLQLWKSMHYSFGCTVDAAHISIHILQLALPLRINQNIFAEMFSEKPINIQFFFFSKLFPCFLWSCSFLLLESMHVHYISFNHISEGLKQACYNTCHAAWAVKFALCVNFIMTVHPLFLFIINLEKR